MEGTYPFKSPGGLSPNSNNLRERPFKNGTVATPPQDLNNAANKPSDSNSEQSADRPMI